MPGSSAGVLSETLAMAASSPDRLERVVHEHSRVLYAIAFSLLRNHHDSEEAVQETFIRFWRHRGRWALIRNRRAWLARAVWRAALDIRRARRVQADSSISLSESARAISRLRAAGLPADEIAARAEMAALLDRMIESLPEDLRHPLELSLAEELSSREISAILGVPEGSVRQRLWRARQILREKLAALIEGQHGR
jgi:RNA polymerase sigma-70 factor (ECF subfamily)